MKKHTGKISILISISFLLATLMLGCLISEPSTIGIASYHTKHFNIYYDESLYSIDEIKNIADKKERLLIRINNFLNTNFDDTVSVRLNKNGGAKHPAWANIFQQTVESYDYVLDDSGHEIVHIVTYKEWGDYSDYDIFTEGIAVATEFDFESPDALTRYIDYRKSIDLYYKLDTSWRKKNTEIYDQILNKSFSGDHYDYIQAGAFVQYIINKYGIAMVKNFYQLSIEYTSGADLIREIENRYDIDLKEISTEFYLDCFG